MTSIRVARRYAQALFATALEQGIVESVQGDIEVACATLDDVPEARAIIENPCVAVQAKQRAVDLVLRGVVSDLLVDFLHLLVRRGRGSALPAVREEYARLRHEHQGTAIADVVSAVPLEPAEVAALTDALSRATGKRIEPRLAVAPELLGGVRVVVGDRVWDGSVRNALERLRRHLKHQDVVGAVREIR